MQKLFETLLLHQMLIYDYMLQSKYSVKIYFINEEEKTLRSKLPKTKQKSGSPKIFKTNDEKSI